MDTTSIERLRARRAELDARFEAFRRQGLALDMTRGKPAAAQLDLSAGLLVGDAADHRAADGTDCRNYGGLCGLDEARALFAEVLGLEAAELIVHGNSSLDLMHTALTQALLEGVPGGDGPWHGKVAKFLCPVPGYDRHFAICEQLGIGMLNVAMTSAGPDLDAVERLVADDPSVKGMWCVPQYSNPTGVTYAGEVVDRLAAMRCAAPGFRLMWDNAYALHDLDGAGERVDNVLAACRRAGHPDRALVFASTSKITFPGAGVALFAASPANLKHLVDWLSKRTIGPDKLTQLRHVRFLRDAAGVRAHMHKHAALLSPKFQAVQEVLARELGELGLATWSRPAGGYFVSLDVPLGCASRVVAMAAEAGVKLTPAGATFPYGKDPRDSNIRLAPTMPPLDDVRLAMEVVTVCVQRAALATLEHNAELAPPPGRTIP